MDFFKSLLTHIGAVLKPGGFSKKGATFTREQAGNLGLVNIQKSQSSSQGAVRFTVNVGVVSGRVANAFGVDPRRIGAGDWHWRYRLGHLLPERSDKWWEVDASPSRVQTVGDEVGSALVGTALPEIEKHLSDEALRDLWSTGASPGLTELQRLQFLIVLLQALGPRDQVNPRLEDLRKISTGSAAFLERKIAASGSA